MVHTGPKYDAEGFPGGLRSEGYQMRAERAVNAAPIPAAEKFRARNAASATSKFLDKRPSLQCVRSSVFYCMGSETCS